MEMELKLLLDPAMRPAIEQHPMFKAVEPRTRKATSTYYDTAAFDLYRGRACLRVRQSGNDFVQTVKLERANDAIGTRDEWEWPLTSAIPDLVRLRDLPDETAALRAFAGDLKPIFRTVVERTTWLLPGRDGTMIEAVIDRGTIEASGKSLDISEVELELKAGAPAPMFRLAIDLAERAHLRFGSQSKSERGYALLGLSLPDRPNPGSSRLDADISIGDAFPRLVNTALRDLAAEIPAASAGEVEAVHRMRAAIRKLRSLLVLFAPYLDRRTAKRFNGTLRELGAVLGQGRDWDVFLTETLPGAEADSFGAEADGLKADIAPLRGPAETLRAEAHAAIAEVLRAHLITGLILGLGVWTADGTWCRKIEAETRLTSLAPALLDDLDRQVRKRARKLDLDDVEDLHDLRKSLKKLRYSIDDVGSLFDADAVRHHHHALKDLLGILGDVNDAAVTEHRVEDLAPADKPDLAPAVAALLHQNDQRRAKALGKLPKKLGRFLALKPFWS